MDVRENTIVLSVREHGPIDEPMQGKKKKAVIKAVENVGKPVEKRPRKGTMRRWSRTHRNLQVILRGYTDRITKPRDGHRSLSARSRNIPLGHHR